MNLSKLILRHQVKEGGGRKTKPVSPILYFGLQIFVLEPLGFLDIHVSQVPEGPNGFLKITEERYRYCWHERDILFDNELEKQALSDNRLP